jgi:hypothetical protein
MSAEEYLESILAEILSGCPKEESIFSGEPGFDVVWDTLTVEAAAGGTVIPGEIE